MNEYLIAFLLVSGFAGVIGLILILCEYGLPTFMTSREKQQRADNKLNRTKGDLGVLRLEYRVESLETRIVNIEQKGSKK